jgi:hypothetical protein
MLECCPFLISCCYGDLNKFTPNMPTFIFETVCKGATQAANATCAKPVFPADKAKL